MAADYDQRWLHKVFDGGAFAQELGIGDHRCTRLDCRGNDFVAGSGKDRATDDDGKPLGTPSKVGRDVLRHLAQMVEVKVAVGGRRRAHAKEGVIGVAQSVRSGLCGGNEAGGTMFLYKRFQSGLVEWRLAIQDGAHFAAINVDTNDTIAEVGKTRGRDTAHIAESEDCDSGLVSLSL